MHDYTDTVQELACLERLRQRATDAELGRSLSLRLRGGVETAAFIFEVDTATIREDIRVAAALDGLGI